MILRRSFFDGRPIAKSFSLDREGFALVKHPTIVRNFFDENEIGKFVAGPWTITARSDRMAYLLDGPALRQ